MTGPTACRQGPMVRIHLPPAGSHLRTSPGTLPFPCRSGVPIACRLTQWLNCPAGVRLEDTNDPTGIGKCSPMSTSPVSGPVRHDPIAEKCPPRDSCPPASPGRVQQVRRAGCAGSRKRPTHGPQGRRPTEHRCIREPQGAGSGRAIRTGI
jgi:hypothetical protein